MKINALMAIGLILPALALGPVGCETMKEHKIASGAVIGGATGALAGGVIGHQTGNKTAGALIGAATGAAIGGGIGWYLDRQEEKFRKIEDVEVIRTESAPPVSTETLQTEARPVEHLTLRMNNEVLFAQGAASLTAEGTQKVAQIAQVLRDYPDALVIVRGYASSEGRDDYNLGLSQARADMVKNTLIANKVSPARITSIGMGESNPIASNDTETGRIQNRRVEIEVFPPEDVK